MKTALVLGAGGFIGNHLVDRLKQDGFWVRGVDLKHPEFNETAADDFVICDLRDFASAKACLDRDFDMVFQLAADMGGAGYLFSGENDAEVVYSSAQINLNAVKLFSEMSVGLVFFSSSACVYPMYNQTDPNNPICEESSAYPAQPESEYGWEKLFSERLYSAFQRNRGLDVRIARFHNIFGPRGTWRGGREKAPAALCRKVAEAADGGQIELWGDGKQTRSFLHIDDCIDGVMRLVNSRHSEPVNIGSEEMIRLVDLAQMIIDLSGKKLSIRHVDGPQGVRGRNSDNRRLEQALGWRPEMPLIEGIGTTYAWVADQVAKSS